MSRISKKPVTILSGVDVSIDGQLINVKGPKGQLSYRTHDMLSVEKEDNLLRVKEKNLDELGKTRISLNALAGTTCMNITNLIKGVSEGFERKLLLVGVGYRAQSQGNKLNLSLGFSHPVVFEIPEGIAIETPSQTEIVIKGCDKHMVGQVAANIRAIRSVEPYKGKGIRYSDEVVILKETKKK